MPYDGTKTPDEVELAQGDIAAGYWFDISTPTTMRYDADGLVWAHKDSTIVDGVLLNFGTNNDAVISHDGNNCVFINKKGDFTVRHSATLGDGDIVIDNNSHGYNMIFTNENAGGVDKETLRLDPDLECAKTQILRLVERAASAGDVAGQGQLWIKNTTPCELWFTDDAGTDTKII